MNKKTILYIVVALIVGAGISQLLTSNPKEAEHVHEEETVYTCSMHPQIRQNEPGVCPLCGMDLIPVGQQEESLISEIDKVHAGIRSAEVKSIALNPSVQVLGEVKANGDREARQVSHVPGRIEELKIKTVGEQVTQGQVIATIYSPELINAQKELYQAHANKNSSPEIYAAVLKKFDNWKVSQRDIDQMLYDKEIWSSFPIRSDLTGIVSKTFVEEGDHLQLGSSIFNVVDLSSIWIEFDVYETDQNLVKVGDRVELEVKGATLQTNAEIVYVSPTADSKSKTTTARAILLNAEGNLKPGQSVRGVIRSAGSEGIAIPRSAVLWTGERSVVYIEEGKDYLLREISIGAEIGDSLEVTGGLSPGEMVVINGAFSIDAAMQLNGKTSMMTLEHSDLKLEWNEEQINAYLALKKALANDDLDASKKAIEKFEAWVPKGELLNDIQSAQTIKSLRKSFLVISKSIVNHKDSLKSSKTLYLQHCPMAYDSGADWISEDEEIFNPYFGDEMLHCGFTKEEL